ncbi:MAG: hypothetical protein AAF503_15220 [Pseudomonadota bacterium]
MNDQTLALSGVKVLLAEDNPTNQMVAIQMLFETKRDGTPVF